MTKSKYTAFRCPLDLTSEELRMTDSMIAVGNQPPAEEELPQPEAKLPEHKEVK